MTGDDSLHRRTTASPSTSQAEEDILGKETPHEVRKLGMKKMTVDPRRGRAHALLAWAPGLPALGRTSRTKVELTRAIAILVGEATQLGC
nr:unnamed protein product [Digitaria exilis]